MGAAWRWQLPQDLPLQPSNGCCWSGSCPCCCVKLPNTLVTLKTKRWYRPARNQKKNKKVYWLMPNHVANSLNTIHHFPLSLLAFGCRTNFNSTVKKRKRFSKQFFSMQSIPGKCLCWLYIGSVWYHMVGDKGTSYSTIHNEKNVLKGWLLKERALKLGSGSWIKSQDKIAFLLILLCVIHTYNDSLLLKSPGCLVFLLSHLHQFYIWILPEWEN